MSIEQIKTNNQRIYDAGYDTGRQTEYDTFWDGLQNNGSRTHYQYFLYDNVGLDWFKPKYDIRPTNASWFARDWLRHKQEAIDLVEVLNECGVTMDFSQSTDVTYLFYTAKVSHLPEINISSATSGANTLLFGQYVKTIDKFIGRQNAAMTQVFGYCSRLENIVFGSEIGGDLTMKDCKNLSKASIESLFEHLSATTTGLTVTLSQTAVDNAFTAEEWSALEGTKSNWTISLV